MRLNKFLSEAGVCSRREADRLVEQGHITVDGKTAVCGMQVGAAGIPSVGSTTAIRSFAS